MCALCGVLLSEHWAEQEGGRRARVARVRLLNEVLRYFGLELGDWGGAIYVLRDRKGRSAVVADLGALWAEAERMLGHPLDPLEPGLVGALAGGYA